MKITLNNKILNDLDLSVFYDHLVGSSFRYFGHPSGKEHYRLLIYLSQQFSNKVFVDLGTSSGGSALALSSKIDNFVLSFDVMDRTNCAMMQKFGPVLGSYLKNIDYIVSQNFLKYFEIIRDSSIILLDIDHSGIVEKKLIDLLIENNYKGLVIMDDIHEFKTLTDLWDSITIKKYDITKYSHSTGTGLIDFSGELELVLE